MHAEPRQHNDLETHGRALFDCERRGGDLLALCAELVAAGWWRPVWERTERLFRAAVVEVAEDVQVETVERTTLTFANVNLHRWLLRQHLGSGGARRAVDGWARRARARPRRGAGHAVNIRHIERHRREPRLSRPSIAEVVGNWFSEWASGDSVGSIGRRRGVVVACHELQREEQEGEWPHVVPHSVGASSMG